MYTGNDQLNSTKYPCSIYYIYVCLAQYALSIVKYASFRNYALIDIGHTTPETPDYLPVK